jgi:Uma2 family endonuclease
MGMPATTFYTAEMVRELIQEDRAWPRYETVHGELLVTPVPRPMHQELAGRLLARLSAWLDRETASNAHAFLSPADISWGPDSLVQPDVFVVPIEEARTLQWSGVSHLLLAIEVLSPSSVRTDRFAKRRLYQERGVPVYWIVDADERAVEIWTPEAVAPVTERQTLHWHPAGASGPFTLPLDELFRPI